MPQTAIRRLLCGVVVLCVTLGANAARADIVMVNVGNAGNAADSTGYGSVGYNYQIGKYEVTAGQYTAFLSAVAATDTYGLYNIDMWSSSYGCKIERSGSSGSYTYSVASDYASRPVNYVSWYDAARYTNWLTTGNTESGVYTFSGGTLQSIADHQLAGATYGTAYFIPTENEWYKAAYHDKSAGTAGTYFDYPTSSDTAPGRDMTEDTNPGNNANYYASGYWIGSPYYRTTVGEFELSDSPYGTFDQGGNVWEWNEADIFGDGSSRGLRGGSFAHGSVTLASSYRVSSDPTFEDISIGFRVSSVPEPGSIALLVSGGVVGLTWWWRRTSHGGRRSPGTTRSSSVPTPAVRRRRTRRGRGE